MGTEKTACRVRDALVLHIFELYKTIENIYDVDFAGLAICFVCSKCQ